MNRVLYSDATEIYKLLDFNRSHSELILRKRINCTNTDILFRSVQSVFLAFELNGIEISIIEDDKDLSYLKQRFYFTTDYGYRIYSMKTFDNKIFYLNAGVFGVFKNDLDILESSAGSTAWSASNELVYWSDKDVK
jgi:hypothetical protein